MKKTIGILGGMGPEATVYMLELIIQNTKAAKDQEHIPMIIYNQPHVPPRTDAIQNKGPDPTPYLIKGVNVLIQGGADFVIMPCITAHYFIPKVKAQIDFSFLNLLEESLNWTKRHIPGLKRAGIVASTGTISSKLFHDYFGNHGIEIIHPDIKEQQIVMEAIFGEGGIKAGYTQGDPKNNIITIAKTLIQKGAEAIIAGCTEVPLVLKDQDIPVPLIEPMLITAQSGIIKAGYCINPRK